MWKRKTTFMKTIGTSDYIQIDGSKMEKVRTITIWKNYSSRKQNKSLKE